MCEHTCKDTKVMLMSNDMLLIAPNQIHEFSFYEQVEIYNRQFFEDVLDPVFLNSVNNLNFSSLRRTTYSTLKGTSPVGHLDRLRVLKALELLREYDSSIGDIAAQVGIYDANYFTRLFKKYLGYPPRHFLRSRE